MIRRDNHHILNNRIEWSARKESVQLRETPSLIPLLDRSVHEDLHRYCPAVPMLGVYALQHVARTFQPSSDTFQSIDNLMLAIERAADHPKAHQIERELAYIAIDAIDLQRPFIKEGIVLPKDRRHLTIVS